MATHGSQLRLAVLASGEGTTLEAIAGACSAGTLEAEIVVVIGNNRDSGALRRARERSLPHAHLSALTHANPDELDVAMLETLVRAKAELVVLAGFMKKVGPRVLAAFDGKIINTHPALLPKYGGQGMYGQRVHEAVLAARETHTGVSVHLVTSEYDAGPVVAQVQVPVFAEDTVTTLSERVQTAERAFLIQTLQGIACKSPNPSFEGTSSGMLRMPTAAPQVKR
jgi:phosphoribosylglycinamide formyltransferase-1